MVGIEREDVALVVRDMVPDDSWESLNICHRGLIQHLLIIQGGGSRFLGRDGGSATDRAIRMRLSTEGGLGLPLVNGGACGGSPYRVILLEEELHYRRMLVEQQAGLGGGGVHPVHRAISAPSGELGEGWVDLKGPHCIIKRVCADTPLLSQIPQFRSAIGAS